MERASVSSTEEDHVLPSWLPLSVATSRLCGIHLARGWQVGADHSARLLMHVRGANRVVGLYLRYLLPFFKSARLSQCRRHHPSMHHNVLFEFLHEVLGTLLGV